MYGQRALTYINFSEYLLIPTACRITVNVFALFIKDYIFLQALTPFLAPFTSRNDRYVINRSDQAPVIMAVVFERRLVKLSMGNLIGQNKGWTLWDIMNPQHKLNSACPVGITGQEAERKDSQNFELVLKPKALFFLQCRIQR